MIWAILALHLCDLPRNAHGALQRSREPVRQFMRANPCPDGPDKGSRKHCRGWRVDHMVPICAGGADAPANMAWQTYADSKKKDEVEIALCNWIAVECHRGK